MVIKIGYAGFIANCDDTILKVDLENGFEIQKLEHDDGFRFIQALNRTDQMQTIKSLMWTSLFNGKKPFYFISKVIEICEPANTAPDDDFNNTVRDSSMRLHGEGTKYTLEKLRLLRLFNEGNITSPISYIYQLGPTIRPMQSYMTMNSVQDETFHLESSLVEEANDFLKNNVLPFKDKKLNDALETFELSYNVTNRGLSFTSGIMAIEILLSPSNTELKYRISRNLATLIGKDLASSQEIFKEMKDLYDLRSRFIHSLEANISSSEIAKAREFARDAIKTFHHSGLNREQLLSKLSEMGFGDNRPW